MLNQSAAAKVQANLQELFKSNLDPGDAYIKFQISSDITALLSMEQIQESLIVEANRITALPCKSESVIGMISSRDRVFCVFDLAQLLNLASELNNPRQYQIMVMQTDNELPIYVGLAVANLQGIIRLSKQQIQLSKDNVDANFIDYTSGTIQQEDVIIPILNFGKILETIKVKE